MIPVPVERVKEIISLNRKKKIPEALMDIELAAAEPVGDYKDILDQDSLTRFEDKRSRKKKRKKRKKRNKPSDPNS
jgi:hypothetical protein